MDMDGCYMVITRGILTVLHNILGMRISMKMDGHLAIPPKLVHFHTFWSWHLKVYCFRCFRPNRNRDSSNPPNVINGEDSSRNKSTHYWGGHRPRGVGKMIIDAMLWGATKTPPSEDLVLENRMFILANEPTIAEISSTGHVVAVRCVPWHGNKRHQVSTCVAHLRCAVDLLHLATERWSRSLKWAETRKDECSQGWEDLLTGWERPENHISLETKIWNHALEEFNICLTIPTSQKLSQHNYGLHWNEHLSNQNQADPNFMP